MAALGDNFWKTSKNFTVMFYMCLPFFSQDGGVAGRHPLDRHPLWADTPWADTHLPWAETPPERYPQAETPLWTDTPSQRDGKWSGWYASYWNAFLFGKIFAENCTKIKEIGPGGVPSLPRTANEYYLIKSNLLESRKIWSVTLGPRGGRGVR